MENKERITNNTEDPCDICQIYDNFMSNMTSIKNFFDTNLPTIEKRNREITEELEKFIEQHSVRLKKNMRRMTLSRDEKHSFERMLKNMQATSHSPLLSNSSFLILITNFEYIIKAVLKCLLLKHPKSIIDKKDIKIDFDDIFSCNNLEEFKDYVVNNYLDKLFYKSFVEQKDILLKLLKICDDNKYINFKTLETATKHRNIIAHNNSIITEELANLLGLPQERIGEKTVISKEVFHKTYEEILFFGLFMMIHLANKLNEQSFIDGKYPTILFDLLEEKEYSVTKRLYQSLSKEIKYTDGESEIVSNINFLIALKNINTDKEIFQEELSAVKIGHLDSRYKTAISALKEDKTNFLKTLPTSRFTVDEWDSFPLFDGLKSDPELTKNIQPILIKNTKLEIKRSKDEGKKEQKIKKDGEKKDTE